MSKLVCWGQSPIGNHFGVREVDKLFILQYFTRLAIHHCHCRFEDGRWEQPLCQLLRATIDPSKIDGIYWYQRKHRHTACFGTRPKSLGAWAAIILSPCSCRHRFPVVDFSRRGNCLMLEVTLALRAGAACTLGVGVLCTLGAGIGAIVCILRRPSLGAILVIVALLGAVVLRHSTWLARMDRVSRLVLSCTCSSILRTGASSVARDLLRSAIRLVISTRRCKSAMFALFFLDCPNPHCPLKPFCCPDHNVAVCQWFISVSSVVKYCRVNRSPGFCWFESADVGSVVLFGRVQVPSAVGMKSHEFLFLVLTWACPGFSRAPRAFCCNRIVWRDAYGPTLLKWCLTIEVGSKSIGLVGEAGPRVTKRKCYLKALIATSATLR